MLTFSLLAALLVAVALGLVLPPLLRRSPAGAVTQDAANVSVYRDQLAELERDLAQGTLSADQHAAARSEIEQRLAEDLRTTAQQAPVVARSGKIVAIVLALALPATAMVGYRLSGTPTALDPVQRLGMSEEDAAERTKMVELTTRLAQRMAEKPDDPKGWIMLARSYRALEKLPDAVRAFGRAVALAPQDAELRADFAETIALSQGGRIEGQALTEARKALELDARSEKALALLGTAAFEAKDFPKAIDFWERLLSLAPPGSEYAQAVQGGIDKAREELAQSAKPAGAAPAAAGKVDGRVSLAPALEGQAKPEDIVFIFARAAEGPRMPLAVLRKQVKDLPLTFTLDDSMAMAEGRTLSAAGQVIVGARISRSGNPMPASGDLEGQTGPVAVGAKGLAIVIDRAVP